MKKRNRLICVLGALILMNPLSFVFGFHCHFNRSGFYCHRRSACLSRRSSRHVSDSNSIPTSRKGKHVFTTSPTPTPVPIVMSTPTPIPTPIPTQVVYIPPVATPTIVPGGFRSSYACRDIEKHWNDFFIIGQEGGKVSGKAYFRAMQTKLIFRQTVVRHDVPKHIIDNFNRFVALYDLDHGAQDQCGAIWENDEEEGNLCYYSYYNSADDKDEL